MPLFLPRVALLRPISGQFEQLQVLRQPGNYNEDKTCLPWFGHCGLVTDKFPNQTVNGIRFDVNHAPVVHPLNFETEVEKTALQFWTMGFCWACKIKSGRQISLTTGQGTTHCWGTQPAAGRALVSHQRKQVSRQSAARRPAGQATSPTFKYSQATTWASLRIQGNGIEDVWQTLATIETRIVLAQLAALYEWEVHGISAEHGPVRMNAPNLTKCTENKTWKMKTKQLLFVLVLSKFCLTCWIAGMVANKNNYTMHLPMQWMLSS